MIRETTANTDIIIVREKRLFRGRRTSNRSNSLLVTRQDLMENKKTRTELINQSLDKTITHPEKKMRIVTLTQTKTAGHEMATDFTDSSKGRDEGKGSIVSTGTSIDRDECPDTQCDSRPSSKFHLLVRRPSSRSSSSIVVREENSL